MLKEAAQKKKEKLEEIEAKKRIKAKIEADKAERRRKAEAERAARAGLAPPVHAELPPTPSGPVSSKPATTYTESRMRFQTSKGNILKTFPVTTTLFEVAASLNKNDGIEVQSFIQNFPRKVFDSEYFGETLKELGLVPSASLIVQ